MNKPESTAADVATARILMQAPARTKLKDALFKVSTAVHRAIFRASKGRIFGKAFGMPVVELVTTGRRSGKERSTMLAVPIIEGDRLVLVASFAGDDRQPAWYLNLKANPEVRATIAGSTRAMIARTATGEERASLWPRITAVFEGYARYQERTKRPIPMVILEPASANRIVEAE
jgi:deazaflavin-dependent oxidoreductase (nitroreductase family)